MSRWRNMYVKNIVIWWQLINEWLEQVWTEKDWFQVALRSGIRVLNTYSVSQQNIIPTHTKKQCTCGTWQSICSVLAAHPALSCGGSRLCRAAPATSSSSSGGSRGASRPAGISNPSSRFWVWHRVPPPLPPPQPPPVRPAQNPSTGRSPDQML